MRVLLFAAAAALTLTACGGGESAEENNAMMAEDANMMATDNMMIDANAMNGTAMDGNMAVDPATQNMIEQDMNTNTPDTNLANGM
jgi:uridylate kinase